MTLAAGIRLSWYDETLHIAHRLDSVGDLRSLRREVLVAVHHTAAPDFPAYAERIWVGVAAMTETLKELDADGWVVATHPRDELLCARLPVIAPAAVIASCLPDDPDVSTLFARLVTSGLPVSPLPPDRAHR